LGYLTLKEESLIYNPQTSFPNNEPIDVGLRIKPKSTGERQQSDEIEDKLKTRSWKDRETKCKGVVDNYQNIMNVVQSLHSLLLNVESSPAMFKKF